MTTDDVCFFSALDLAEKIRTRKISAVEVIESFLDRIARINPALNAYVTVCEEQARRDARRADQALLDQVTLPALHGVPFSVKDVFYTSGVRTTAGSRIYENFVPDVDAISVARLRTAGGILLGKTNTPEFGYKATTENPLFGPTRNPWSLERTAGGSSGGAAAATAAGIAPLSLGSDGGGSIRIPASFCGVFGLKPTFGVVPSVPGFAGWKTLVHVGPLTRTVRDAALMLDVMAGPHELDRTSIPGSYDTYSAAVAVPRRGLRLGYSPDLGFARVDREVMEVISGALPTFAEMGHHLEEISLNLEAAKSAFQTIVLAENAGAHAQDFARHRERMDEGLVKFIEMGLDLKATDYVQATHERDHLAARLASFFSQHDLLLTPTVAVLPFPIGESARGADGLRLDPLDWIPFTYPFNLTGNPAATVPCGMSSGGLPIGLQIVGPRHADGLVLNLCAQFEEARPWAGVRPGNI